VGAPLVDEEGRLAGLVLDTDGRAIGADVVELSLRRVAEGQREADAAAKLGLSLEFVFAPVPTAPDQLVFAPRISAVAPNSPAAGARLQRGDIVTAINDEPVAWEKNVMQQLSAAFPIDLSIRRGEATITATLQEVPAPE
jgi:S1-C subfamily serine protease